MPKRHPRHSILSKSMLEAEKQTATLLIELLNEIGISDLETFKEVTSLRSTHINLMISFEQMIDYIDMIRRPLSQGDIKDLLQTYVEMASRYYSQYEISLLNDIKNQHQTQANSEKAIQKINDLKDPDLMAVIKPVETACNDAAAEYAKLLKDFPSLLQMAIDKLKDEWQRLGSIAVASEALTEDKQLLQLLKAVVDVAAHSIGIGAERIVVVPGKEFALYFFKYLDNFAVLTVPLYSVQAPWEWSIFWHELAGYKVRQLEKGEVFDTIKKRLEDVHTLYQASDEAGRQKLLATVAGENQFSQTYLKGLLSDDALDISDFGSFEHQFEQMLTKLPKKKKLQIYQQIKDLGWSVNWLKELFEDAWSVLAIGEQFLPFFQDVLRRHTARDDRHPPFEIRMQVSREFLSLAESGSLMAGGILPETPEAAAAQQILKYISLLRCAARKLDMDGEDALNLQEFRDNLFIGVTEEIQGAISKWATQFENRDDQKEVDYQRAIARARQYAQNVIQSFSDDVANTFLAGFSAYDAKEKNQIKPCIDEMLKDKDYKQLIDFPFYDVDFHVAGDIQLSESGNTYWVHPNDWKSELWSALRHPAGNNILSTQTVVTEVVGGARWAVNKNDWNGWFKMTQ